MLSGKFVLEIFWLKMLVESFRLNILVDFFWCEIWEEMPYLISLNSLFKNKAYIGSWKHFVFVFVCVSIELSSRLKNTTQ